MWRVICVYDIDLDDLPLSFFKPLSLLSDRYGLSRPAIFPTIGKYCDQPGVHTTLHHFTLNTHMYEGTEGNF